MIQGAIFDMDGTLLDSMGMWANIGTEYLRSLGYVPEENLNQIFKDMSLAQAAGYYRTHYGVTLSVDEIINGVNNALAQFYHERVQLKPGVMEFLRRLEGQGVKMCLATATDRPLVEAALKHCGIADCFSEIYTCHSVGHGKDEPVIYRAAAEHLGVPKCSIVVFEDALYAVRTAKRDNYVTAAVYDQYEEGQAGIQALADIYIKDYTQAEHFWEFAAGL
ncbi:MAG: HAD family phosphatase [Oscillospiraceae bacterium]|nr:HAD family phosphatase [Oscillospiraceae bacterium]